MAATDYGLGGRVRPANRLGQTPRTMRRRSAHAQEVVELNSMCLCPMNETKSKKIQKQKTEVERLSS
jgi:hypothetical protein